MDLLNTPNGIATTDGLIYLITVATLEKLEIQFIPKLSTQRTHNVADFEVIGRNTPRYQSTGGKSTISLKLDFYADDEKRQSAIQKVRWLESLCATNGYSSGAQQVKLVWGKLYRNQKWVVKSVKADLDLFHRVPEDVYDSWTNVYIPNSNSTDLTLNSNGTINNAQHKNLIRKQDNSLLPIQAMVDIELMLDSETNLTRTNLRF